MLDHQDAIRARREYAHRQGRRRLTALTAVVVALVAIAAALAIGASGGNNARVANGPAQAGGGPSGSQSAARSGPVGQLPAVSPARPGTAHVIRHGAARAEIALTFDDGFCKLCVARTVSQLVKTGAHATIFPNGTYSAEWAPHAPTIRRLIAKGQLLVGNHTFLHHDPVAESPAAFKLDLLRNERWIERTFGVSAYPFFRPPYGAYNATTLAIAGRAGYTKVITWSGTVADSSPRTVNYILAAIRHWAAPGAIILMHANYPATSIALPQIVQILKQRGLRPVTLKELLG